MKRLKRDAKIAVMRTGHIIRVLVDLTTVVDRINSQLEQILVGNASHSPKRNNK